MKKKNFSKANLKANLMKPNEVLILNLFSSSCMLWSAECICLYLYLYLYLHLSICKLTWMINIVEEGVHFERRCMFAAIFDLLSTLQPTSPTQQIKINLIHSNSCV